MNVRPSPTCEKAVADTADRLGPPPPVETFGWTTWLEEAAGLICARLRKGQEHLHSRVAPCRRCRTLMRAYLVHLHPKPEPAVEELCSGCIDGTGRIPWPMEDRAPLDADGCCVCVQEG